MLKKLVIGAVALISVSPVASWAQGFHALQPAQGWACMMLNLTEQQSLDPTVHVPVFSQPSASARSVGWAPMTVAVREPSHPVNGFAEMLRPNGHRVWIREADLRPWKSLADPTAKCVPSEMSNGTYGFAYPH